MEDYLIELYFSRPYPVQKSYRVKASSFASAIGKAYRLWRKEDGKGLKLKFITIKATKI